MVKKAKRGRPFINRIDLERVISTTTSRVRFSQFYESIIRFCKEVKVLFIKYIGGSKVKFEVLLRY